MKPLCIINQPSGIGDIFFCQKIACQFIKKGYEIIWPVIPEFFTTTNYISNEINFLDINKDFPYKNDLNDIKTVKRINNDIILPLKYADLVFSGSMMDAKYKMVDTTYNDWPDYFNFKRNTAKEDHLYYDIIGLNDSSKFIFINENYGSPPNFVKRPIYLKSDKQKVYMDFYPGINIFDWIKVLENSLEIHTVETALNYIIEKLVLNNKFFMYAKLPHNHFNYVSHLFKKPWNYKQ